VERLGQRSGGLSISRGEQAAPSIGRGSRLGLSIGRGGKLSLPFDRPGSKLSLSVGGGGAGLSISCRGAGLPCRSVGGKSALSISPKQVSSLISGRTAGPALCLCFGASRSLIKPVQLLVSASVTFRTPSWPSARWRPASRTSPGAPRPAGVKPRLEGRLGWPPRQDSWAVVACAVETVVRDNRFLWDGIALLGPLSRPPSSGRGSRIQDA
jgi:hypothetical protein